MTYLLQFSPMQPADILQVVLCRDEALPLLLAE